MLGVAPALGQTAAEVVNQNPDVASMTVSDLGQLWDTYEIPLLAIMAVVVLLLLMAGKVVTPGGLAKSGLRDVTPLPAMVWCFAGVVGLMVLPAAHTLILETPRLNAWVSGGELAFDGNGDPLPITAANGEPVSDLRRTALITILSFTIGIGVAWGLLYLLSRSTENAGLGVKALDVPVGAGCFVLAYPIIALSGIAAVLLYEEVTGSRPGPLAHDTLSMIYEERDDPWRWGLIFGAIILAPVFEELVWRGCFQSALLKLTGSPWGAVVITSLGFALLHRLGGGAAVPWHALLTLFTLSVAMGIAFERTKRLGVPITMHLCFNALNIALVLTMPEAAGGDVPLE